MAAQQQQQQQQQGRVWTPVYRPFNRINSRNWGATIRGFTDDKLSNYIASTDDYLERIKESLAETDENIDVDLRQLQKLLKKLLKEREIRRRAQQQQQTQGNGIPLVALAGIVRKFRGHL